MDFFVVGTSRSGSTLLRHMLAAHPDVAVLNESHWLPRMWETARTSRVSVDALIEVLMETRWDSGRRVLDVNLELGGKSQDVVIGSLRERLGAKATVADFHDALVDELFGRAPGSVRRGDKTPDYGFYMTLLQQIWPGARFVHVVRNGIDAARSMARHPGCQLMISAGYDNWVPLSYRRAHERHRRRELPFDAYVRSWRRRMERIREEASALTAGSYREARYERLLVDPRDVAREVAAHLDLDAPEPWLDRCAQLPRPRPPAAPLTADSLRELELEDLRLLNDVGGVPFLRFPPGAELRQLEAALCRAERSSCGDEPLAVALGTLATRTAESLPELVQQALRLLRQAVTASGREAGRWALLRRSGCAR